MSILIPPVVLPPSDTHASSYHIKLRIPGRELVLLCYRALRRIYYTAKLGQYIVPRRVYASSPVLLNPLSYGFPIRGESFVCCRSASTFERPLKVGPLYPSLHLASIGSSDFLLSWYGSPTSVREFSQLWQRLGANGTFTE